jgi:hypothetical protein
MDKAQQAINLLMDGFFTGEINSMKHEAITRIVNSHPEDYDLREEQYRTIRALDALVAHFQAIADDKLVEKKRWKIL